jgi:hypothetical protein
MESDEKETAGNKGDITVQDIETSTPALNFERIFLEAHERISL